MSKSADVEATLPELSACVCGESKAPTNNTFRHSCERPASNGLWAFPAP